MPESTDEREGAGHAVDRGDGRGVRTGFGRAQRRRYRAGRALRP
ncbi:hypothetical protein [Salinibacter ruber]|nr:hypothetical protein [Salinibacter ruber]